jgi:hypothetical protein
MGSNPVMGKSLFPCARNFTLIAQYWFIPGSGYNLGASYTNNQSCINQGQIISQLAQHFKIS